ncbi:MAG: hypothetical protein R2806_04950 [Saprospiraceae bacterium]
MDTAASVFIGTFISKTVTSTEQFPVPVGLQIPAVLQPEVHPQAERGSVFVGQTVNEPSCPKILIMNVIHIRQNSNDFFMKK